MPIDPETAVAQELRRQFPDTDPDDISRRVAAAFRHRARDAVQDFVPLLAEREVREDLRTLVNV